LKKSFKSSTHIIFHHFQVESIISNTGNSSIQSSFIACNLWFQSTSSNGIKSSHHLLVTTNGGIQFQASIDFFNSATFFNHASSVGKLGASILLNLIGDC
jgi:hypothetical protein